MKREMIGDGPSMQRVNYLIQRVAQSDVDCLILGETGTGKELVAKKIHDVSWRQPGPFIPVNCSALSETLFESELFGHVKGAFTGAIDSKKGRFELANNGTLFLDEIGELSPAMQVKLLRSIQERQIEKVGDSKIINVNVRIVAATNRNLRELIQEGRFREDFYYRINVFSINLPPLRRRPEDIIVLAHYFVRFYGGHQKLSISNEVQNIFRDYSWPGNIRQLENAVRHALVLAEETILPHHLPDEIMASEEICLKSKKIEESKDYQNAYVLSEKTLLIDALKKSGGNRSKAAQILGVSRVTVWNRMKKYNLLPKNDFQ